MGKRIEDGHHRAAALPVAGLFGFTINKSRSGRRPACRRRAR